MERLGDDPLYKSIGQSIMKRREEMRITRAELSDISGVSESYIYALEKDFRKKASLSVTVKLFRALGISLDNTFLHCKNNDDETASLINTIKTCSSYELGAIESMALSFLAYERRVKRE